MKYIFWVPLESPGALFHSLSSLHPMPANCVNSRGTKPQEEKSTGALMLTVHIKESYFCPVQIAITGMMFSHL